MEQGFDTEKILIFQVEIESKKKNTDINYTDKSSATCKYLGLHSCFFSINTQFKNQLCTLI